MSAPSRPPLATLGQALLRQHDGPLTQELARKPGGFGLGQVPARLKPDATTTMVCGFCSTGCGLDVHLQRRRGGQPDAGDATIR